MNLRCMYCQTMFGVSRDVMLIGLQTMEEEKLTHYDIHCPKCRRANRVERKKLELANPKWKESLKQMAKDASKAEREKVKDEKPATKVKAASKKSPSKSKTTATKKPAAKKKATTKAK